MIVFITGATSGIGKACAAIFASHGHDLVLTGRRADRLEAIKNELQQSHSIKVHTLCFDIRQKEAVHQAVESLPETFKGIDILINNAGLAAGLSTIQNGLLDDWERMVDTNVKGLLYITRALIPNMVARNKGHIVNLGSIAGKETYPNGNVYCATKHAVDALNKGMRLDLLPHGIKVSSINPGMVETEFSIVRFNGDVERAKNAYKGLTPLSAEDIAETIFWVCSRPAHVNINEVIIMPTAQANATNAIRKTE